MEQDSGIEQKLGRVNRYLSVQTAIAQAVASSLALEDILTHTLQQILEKMGLDMGVIYLLDRGTETLRLVHQEGVPAEVTETIEVLELEESMTLQMAQRGGDGVTSLTPEAYPPAHRRAFEKSGLQTLIGVTLWARKRIMGTALLGSAEPWEIDKEDTQFLTSLGQQVGGAIDNALLYEMAQRRVEELSMLHRVGQTLTASLEPDEVITAIMKETRVAVGGTGCSVALLDEEKEELLFTTVVGGATEGVPGVRLALGQGIAGWVAQKGEPVLVHDAQNDPRFFGGVDADTGFLTRSILCVPMRLKGKIIGVVEVVNKIDGYFDSEDMRVLNSLATSAAVAIENSRLYQQQRETAQELAARNEALLEAQRRLVWAERLAVIGEIGLAMHQELDAPLTTILRTAESLLSRDDLPHDAREQLETIARKGIQIGDAVKKLESEEEI
jgi:GAF domain-containing protein